MVSLAQSDLRPNNNLTKEDLEQLILSFAASFCLADHLGDAADDLYRLLRAIRVDVDFSDLDELHQFLSRNSVKTLVGTSLTIDEVDSEEE